MQKEELKRQKAIKAKIEMYILIIKSLTGVISGCLGFFLYNIFKFNYIFAFIFWIISGLLFPLIPIYLLFKNNLKFFGKTRRVIYYGLGTNLVFFILTYTVIFLITAYL
ncbi:MAG: hypothetical protein ACTSQO_05400 [Candidatus Helarchaeota archaeon]